MRLRPTSPADVPWVVALEGHPDHVGLVTAWSAAEHRAALADPDLRHLVIEGDEGERAGYLILAELTRADRVVQLLRIVVARKGRGLGRAAVRAAIDLAFSEHGAARLWLDVRADNARARRLYEREGFALDGPSPTDPGFLIMTLVSPPRGAPR